MALVATVRERLHQCRTLDKPFPHDIPFVSFFAVILFRKFLKVLILGYQLSEVREVASCVPTAIIK